MAVENPSLRDPRLFWVRCSQGLQENKFLDLMSSTFPQLGAPTSFEFLMQGTNQRRVLLTVEKTPERIQEFLKSVDFSSFLFVAPKRKESTQSSHEDMMAVPPTPNQLDSMNLEELDNEERDGAVPTDDQDQDEEKPKETEQEKLDTQQPVNSTGAQTIQSSLKTSGTEAFLSCHICQAVCKSVIMLIRHSYSHMGQPERLCGVCGGCG